MAVGRPIRRVRALALALLGAGLPAGVAAQVQVKVLADGTKVIYNETSAQRARRTAGSLLPVPSIQLGSLIDYYARHHDLNPRLVQAVMQAESGYNATALSRKGAMGLMQLMPETARELAVDDPYDPEQNVRGGTAYLRRMLRRFGDLRLALAAYNAGPTAVTRYQDVPPFLETRDYVRKVLSLFQGTSAASPPPLLQEHARDQSQVRQKSEQRSAESRRGGDPVFLTRDEAGRIVITTTAPKPN